MTETEGRPSRKVIAESSNQQPTTFWTIGNACSSSAARPGPRSHCAADVDPSEPGVLDLVAQEFVKGRARKRPSRLRSSRRDTSPRRPRWRSTSPRRGAMPERGQGPARAASAGTRGVETIHEKRGVPIAGATIGAASGAPDGSGWRRGLDAAIGAPGPSGDLHEQSAVLGP
jgi:hypothetical protein